MELNPQEAKYAYTLAFYQKEGGNLQGAAATLKDILPRRPVFTDGYFLLAEIYLQQGERSQAEAVLCQALQAENLPPNDRARLTAALQKLSHPPQKENQPDTR